MCQAWCCSLDDGSKDPKRKPNVGSSSGSCCWQAVRLVSKLDLQRCILEVFCGGTWPPWWGPCLEGRANNTGTEFGQDIYLGGLLSWACSGVFHCVHWIGKVSFSCVEEEGAVLPWPPTL